MLKRTGRVVRVLAGLLCLRMTLVSGFAEETAKKAIASAPVEVKGTLVPSFKKSPYKHPSFIVGVASLSLGVLLGIAAGVGWSVGVRSIPNTTCKFDGGVTPCVFSPRIWAGVVGSFSGVALASGTASMIYWGVKVNIP